MYFKTRLKERGSALIRIYVSEEELKEAIHMDITVEDEHLYEDRIRKKIGG